MSQPHASYDDDPVLAAKRATAEYEAAREEAKLAIELGRAIYVRRNALGISQAELARRAQMTQPAVSRLETGGPVPTLGVLRRLAHALGAELKVELTDAA